MEGAAEYHVVGEIRRRKIVSRVSVGSLCRKMMFWLVVCLVGSAAWHENCAADEHKPVVVVSLVSYEKLVVDINQFVDPRLFTLVREMFGRATNIPTDPRTMAPVSLDIKRPWGLVVETNGQTVSLYGFAPITDLKVLLSGPVAAGTIAPPIDGVFTIKAVGRTWYVKQKGVWSVFSDARDGLDKVPDQPDTILQGMNRSSDLAVRVLFKNLPAELGELAKRWIAEGSYFVLPQEPLEDNLLYAVRNALANQGALLGAELIGDGDTLSAGLSVDLRRRCLVADMEVTYRPETGMAVSLAAPSKSKTDFAGMLEPNATFNGIWTGEIARLPLYELLSVLDVIIEEMIPRSTDKSSLELWRAIRTALQKDSVDGAVMAMMLPDRSTLAIGGYVADSAEVEKKLMDAAKAAQKKYARNGWQWNENTARYRDTRFHTLTIPIAKEKEKPSELARTFGNQIDIVFGISDHHLYVAIGREALSRLKQAVRRSGSRTRGNRPPVRFTVSMAQLTRFLADTSAEGNQFELARQAELLQRSGGRDHVHLFAVPVKHGVRYRLEIEDAVLRAATMGIALR